MVAQYCSVIGQLKSSKVPRICVYEGRKVSIEQKTFASTSFYLLTIQLLIGFGDTESLNSPMSATPTSGTTPTTTIMEPNIAIKEGGKGAFTCSSCDAAFEDNEGQRAHMKTPWHVYNLKRRMASLPSLSESVYGKLPVDIVDLRKTPTKREEVNGQRLENQLGAMKIEESSRDEEYHDDEEVDEHEKTDDEEVEEFEEAVCLFCLHTSIDLDENVLHMRKSHGLFIPNPEGLTDLASFLAYLHTVITAFHECLYCASIRSSPEGVRAHMRAKGHCMVNLEGAKLGEFWEDREENEKGKEEREAKRDEEKMALPGGKVVTKRDAARRYRQHRPSMEVRARRRAIVEAESGAEAEEVPNNDRRVAVNGGTREMGLIGLSDVERRSLRVVEKKMLKVEMRARNEYRSMVEKGGNKQKFFKVSFGCWVWI